MFKKYFSWEIIGKSITITYEKLNKKNLGSWGIMNPINIEIVSINSFSDPLKYP